MFKRLLKKLKFLFVGGSSHLKKGKEPYFDRVEIRTNTPANEEIKERVLIQVVYNGKSYWCLFRCPCGCRKVISLSLQENHEPHWEIKVIESGKPSLFPSVWQNQGCLSHFWIQGGNVLWCGNSGIEPWLAEPDYYVKPKHKPEW